MKYTNTSRLLSKTIVMVSLLTTVIFSSCKKEEDDKTPVPEKEIEGITFLSSVEFKGNDSVQYVLGMVEPASPQVGMNDFKVALYKKVNSTTTVPINNYKIKLDPRMPGMGNHGSPNNVDATPQGADGIYNGKLSLTMTGYWKINLQLENASGDMIKGEAITSSTKSSSIYFEIEF